MEPKTLFITAPNNDNINEVTNKFTTESFMTDNTLESIITKIDESTTTDNSIIEPKITIIIGESTNNVPVEPKRSSIELLLI